MPGGNHPHKHHKEDNQKEKQTADDQQIQQPPAQHILIQDAFRFRIRLQCRCFWSGIRFRWLLRFLHIRNFHDLPLQHRIAHLPQTGTGNRAVIRYLAYRKLSLHQCPKNREGERKRPVITGDGPAGLFCGYLLTLAGFCPTILERGDSIDKRTEKVESFWREGKLDVRSNVQFGEGGAGTFSDGKLNSTIKDRTGRIGFVLETFIKHGAKPSIAYDAKPHLGTDELKRIIADMRRAMEEAGCEFRFNTLVTDLIIENGRVKGAVLDNTGEIIPTDTVVLAIGHSARDTVKMLYERKLNMERKDFAMGFRVIHPQELINRAQYGENYPEELPAADYRLTHTASNGKRVYTFCMCPGGYVVNASSEEGRLAVNGMSYSSRASGYANSAVVAAFESESFINNSYNTINLIIINTS